MLILDQGRRGRSAAGRRMGQLVICCLLWKQGLEEACLGCPALLPPFPISEACGRRGESSCDEHSLSGGKLDCSPHCAALLHCSTRPNYRRLQDREPGNTTATGVHGTSTGGPQIIRRWNRHKTLNRHFNVYETYQCCCIQCALFYSLLPALCILV